MKKAQTPHNQRIITDWSPTTFNNVQPLILCSTAGSNFL